MDGLNKYDVALGKVISERRKELGVTQDKLADKVGVKRPTITCYEKGLRSINATMFFDICDVLYLKPNDVQKKVKELCNEK